MRSLTTVIVICATIITYCNCVVWQDCGSTRGAVSSVGVSGCSATQQICTLKRGHDVTFTVNFKSKEISAKTTAVVHGVIAGVPVPFPLPNPNGCKRSGLTCPLQKGKPYSYSTAIPVLSHYPKVSVVVKWELRDASGKDLFCIEVAAEIKDAAKPQADTRLLFKKLSQHLNPQ